MSGYQRFELEIASIGIEIDSSIPAELSTRCRLFIKAGIESDVQFKIRTGRHNWNDYEIVNTQVSANSHFLRTAGPHFPDSPGHIKRTAWDISRAEGTPPH